MRRVGYVELVRRNPAFRWIWTAELVSLTGDWFTTIAVFAMLLELTGKGEAIGLALAARFLPSLLFGPLAGVAADRLPRKVILIACDLGRALIVLGFLLVRGEGDLWLVYALTFAQLTLACFFETSEQASIGSAVSRPEIVAANSLQGMTWSAMLSLGALLGGLVSAYIGRNAAFTLNAATYLVSALCISRARIAHRPSPRPAGSFQEAAGIEDMREALRYVARSAPLRQALFVKMAWGAAAGAALMLYSVFADRVFRIGQSIAGGIGILYAARGVGALLGPLLARLAGDDREQTLVKWIGWSFWIMAASYVGFAAAPSLAWAALALVLAHMGGSTSWTFSTALLNLRAEDSLRGRVFAADSALFTVGSIASIFVAGRLLDGAGVSPRALMAGVAGCVALAAAAWKAIAQRMPQGAVELAPAPLLPRPPGGG